MTLVLRWSGCLPGARPEWRAGAELNAFGLGGEERERRDRVGAIGFGRPDRVVTQLFRALHECDRHVQMWARITDCQTKLHRHVLRGPRIRSAGSLEQVSAHAGETAMHGGSPMPSPRAVIAFGRRRSNAPLDP